MMDKKEAAATSEYSSLSTNDENSSNKNTSDAPPQTSCKYQLDSYKPEEEQKEIDAVNNNESKKPDDYQMDQKSQFLLNCWSNISKFFSIQTARDLLEHTQEGERAENDQSRSEANRSEIFQTRKTIHQLQGMTRCLATYLLIANLIYLFSRIYAYYDFDQNRHNQYSDAHMKYGESIHMMSLLHSTLYVSISVFIYLLVRSGRALSKMQYNQIMYLTVILLGLYVVPILYITKLTYDSSEQHGIILFLDWMVDTVLAMNPNGGSVFISMLVHAQILMIQFALTIVAGSIAEQLEKMEKLRVGGRSTYNALELNCV